MEEVTEGTSKKYEDFSQEEFKIHLEQTVDCVETVTRYTSTFFDKFPTLIIQPNSDFSNQEATLSPEEIHRRQVVVDTSKEGVSVINVGSKIREAVTQVERKPREFESESGKRNRFVE